MAAPIPSLVVPVLNRPDLLLRMLTSIDHPVERAIVIDNGDMLDPDLGTQMMLPFPVRVIKPGWNLGVAASWNLGIKATPLVQWWLVCNSDLEFGGGDLERLAGSMVSGSDALRVMGSMACFAVTPGTLRHVGWFDENFVPAYDEDLDYALRCSLAGLETIKLAFTGSHAGSATILSDPRLASWNAGTHPENDRYYDAKWGGPKRGGEAFGSPFARGGSVREWDLDIDRLRGQTWPRETR